MSARQIESRKRRQDAADIAAARPPVTHHNNGDEGRLRGPDGAPTYAASFTKCLPHDADGFLKSPTDYSEWVRSIGTGDPRDFRALHIGPGKFELDGELEYELGPDNKPRPKLAWAHTYPAGQEPKLRAWESQGAGLTFDLEGPDAASVTMPPAPSIDSQELIAEMGEVYWMALCRDVAFADWASDATIAKARKSLARLYWFRADSTDRLDGSSDRLASSLVRRRILSQDGTDQVPIDRLFRGVTPGTHIGPYLSQFLLIGNGGIASAQNISDGMIAYGAIRADQRVRIAKQTDFMLTWKEFLDVQNGADTRGTEGYEDVEPRYRFIATPRDMATYVHHDALYESYLNACLILLGMKAPFDSGLPFQLADHVDKQQGFAQFGGPHILTLVTEVATRALKAVRHQKYNIHRRLRPEAVAGWMYQRRNGSPEVKARLTELEQMEAAFAGSSGIGAQLDPANKNWLLPMAFPEGSPTHPSYGAGHATVAGACVTILKAWFDHRWTLREDDGTPIAYESAADGKSLVDVSSIGMRPLTVEGELNKIGENIAIGRDWAGVHYYTDYLESFKLGEQVALGVLEEQKLTYGEAFSMTVPLHDGTSVQV